jgi:cell division protein FtsQ
MARKDFPEDEPDSGSRGSVRTDPRDFDADAIDSRLLDLEPEKESPFLRVPKRVPVRRALPKKTAHRLKYVLLSAAAVAVLAGVSAGVFRYGRASSRFRLQNSDQVQVAGNRHITRGQVVEVFGGDISRNIFLIPLEDRKRQLEQIPWIESASVMRLLPARLSVQVKERTPVGFARVGSRILLVDRNGVLLDNPPAAPQKYSFPVIFGMTASEPLSTRAARMRIYEAVLRDLDSGGANYSHDISEINLSDPQDVRVTADDPQGAVVIHLGAENYLDRYKVYVAHLQEWRQQLQRPVESVDLRFDGQVIVNPDAAAAHPASAATPAPPSTAAPPPAKAQPKPVARPAGKSRKSWAARSKRSVANDRRRLND